MSYQATVYHLGRLLPPQDGRYPHLVTLCGAVGMLASDLEAADTCQTCRQHLQDAQRRRGEQNGAGGAARYR